jgi:integrase/recombinase XerD
MIALIEEYQKELLKVAAYAEDTVENYVSCIVTFIEYSKKTLKIDPVFSKGNHIVKWMAELGNTGISRSRLQHHRSALKTFFNLLCKLKIIKRNPAKALPPIVKLAWKTKLCDHIDALVIGFEGKRTNFSSGKEL